MKALSSAVVLVFVIAVSSPHSLGKEALQADPSELPRIPPTEAADALATFEVRPGFRLELAASEPLVMDPIDIEFDEQGRLFVVEMRGYSERRNEALGRIRMLVDDDGDGFFDRGTTYAEGLRWPTSLCCYDGGVFVAASPEILYFKDTDGDGVSDVRENVFTGFGAGRNPLNMQALVNSLTWGPDNRIWGATAANGGKVRRPDQPEGEALNLSRADFSFEPKTRALRPENGTAQFGMSFDSRGRRFVCSNSDHIRWVAWERHQVKPNPFYSMPAPLVSIAADGAAAPVYRISPDEPWRIVRTRWRVSGVVKGIVEGGGRVSGYFTSATGITIYTGDAFGPEFMDNAFIGDCGSNLVHRKIIRHDRGKGQLSAVRPAEEERIEFLRSRDLWFRPVNFANGPDGCLYICDMYREIIEHPWSLPEGIKQHLDLNSGWDRGRIWRVVPEGFERPKFTLDRENGWQKVVRSRLAFQAGTTKDVAWSASPTVGPSGGRDRWADAFALNGLTTPKAMVAAWKAAGSRNETFRTGLAGMIGRTGDVDAIQAVIETIVAAGVSAESEVLLESLGVGLRVAGVALSRVDADKGLDTVFEAARVTTTNSKARAAERSSALSLLRHDGSSGSAAAICSVIAAADAPDSLRQRAIRFAGARSGDLAPLLIDEWQEFSPVLRAAALEVLTVRAGRAKALLAAVESGRISSADIPAADTEFLRRHRDAGVKALAAKVLPAPPVVDRKSVVRRYQEALKLTGDPGRGKVAYVKGTCITCHQAPSGEGFRCGPDLATFKSAGADSLLSKIFDPNAEVAPQYQAFSFELTNGESVLGLIAREDTTQVTVRMPGGLEKTFPRREVASMKGLGRSLMPDGLEVALTEQDVADLLAFIAAAE